MQKYYLTAEKYSVEAQAQERLERPETKSRKTKKDPASKIKQISKKIAKLQEEIKQVEEELEEAAGHPLSKADKVKDETLGNLMGKVKKLKKEKQELKEKEKDSPKPIEGIKERIEENMENNRALADRPYILEEMNLEELEAEKEELAEQLEELAEDFARKEERKACADLFLRLRQLKRMTRRPSYSSSGIFLDEIPEHSSVEHNWSRRGSIESVSLSEEFEEDLEDSDEKGEEEEEEEEGDWHIMTREELCNAVREMKGQKGRLKQLIKEFDQGVQAKTGRKVTKEERAPIQNIYSSYKKTKSKIKLIEALLSNKASD